MKNGTFPLALNKPTGRNNKLRVKKPLDDNPQISLGDVV